MIEEINRLTRGEAIISTGVGQHQMWAAQYFDFRPPRLWLTSGSMGTMGFGLPAAIGALDYAEICGLYRAFVFEHEQISAVVAVSSDDARSGVVFLWAVDGGTPRYPAPALVLGKVPMFYYLVHFPLIHLLAVAVCYARYGQVHWMFESPTIDKFPDHNTARMGYSLPIVYLIWASVVLAALSAVPMVCGVEQRRSDVWLSYF